MGRKLINVLVVANSARMLAQAANLAGLKPLAIDLYADLDTIQYAEMVEQIQSLTPNDLNRALDKIFHRYSVDYTVFGSGFENCPDSLEILANRLKLFGNLPEVFERLHDKAAFFALLDRLGIPYPEVSFIAPESGGDWLVKPMRGQGGNGIRKYCYGEEIDAKDYWQKFQGGEPHSVLFLADGERSQIVGFNKQWTTTLNEKDEFIFSGIVSATGLTGEQKAKIAGWLDNLVAAFSLKGLNSLDFIQSGSASYVLEINPRPAASMQLYDADLFIRHIKACEGDLYDIKQKTNVISAYQIVYAKQNLTIPFNFAWPEGTQDLPRVNTRINAGQPICSMIMHAQDPERVIKLLQNQQEFIINALDRFQTHGI
jgi:uncharacterized protein